jgi:hypothetical protein
MCGRFTYRLTSEELVKLYRLTLDQPARITQARYNVCPTDPVDMIVATDGKRELVPMRWGLVPRWLSKTIKDVKMATFNARVETVETKPFFRDAFKRTRCLIPASGYYEWQNTPDGKQPWYFTARWLAGPDDRRLVGRVARPRKRGNPEILHHAHHSTQQLRCRGSRSHAGVAGRERLRCVAQRECGRRTTPAGAREPIAALAGVETGQQFEGASRGCHFDRADWY